MHILIKKSPNIKIIILLFFLLTHTSCMSILGFRQDKELSNKEIIKLSKRFSVPEDKLYVVKSKDFRDFTKSKASLKKDRENIEQPNQIIVFDHEYNNITNIINCNVGGFPILKWNRFKGLDSIPIKQGYFYTTPIYLSKYELDNLIIPVVEKQINQIPTIKPQFYYYIFWSRVLFRNSKKMIKLINNNIQIAKKKNIHVDIIYIFSDSIFY